jgi:glycosyltransferase involved in cell wall biosynthesis
MQTFDHARFEVLVIDDGSSDDTKAVVSEFSASAAFSIRYILHDRRYGSGPGFARNDGLRAAVGRIIAFTDADCIVDKDWIERLTSAILDDRKALVGGETWCDETLVFPWRGGPAGQRGITANLALDRSRIKDMFFSDEFRGLVGGDTDFVLRAAAITGAPAAHVPGMRVLHPARELGLRAIARRAKHRRNEVLMLKKHGSVASLNMAAPFRPLIGGRISPVSAAFFAAIMYAVVAIALHSFWMIAAALVIAAGSAVAFIALFYKACVSYVPEGTPQRTLSMKDRVRTLVSLIVYVPAFVLARIRGSVENRTFYL